MKIKMAPCIKFLRDHAKQSPILLEYLEHFKFYFQDSIFCNIFLYLSKPEIIYAQIFLQHKE